MRISTTTLEAFRLFMNPEQEWMSEADLVATIRGEAAPNARMIFGRAFGVILEDPEPYRIPGGYMVDDLTIGDDVMEPMLALIDRPRTVFEAKAVGRYAGHDVVAKADQLCGARLIETKATFSGFDFDKYATSCQWRFMADLFQPVSITYHVACLSESEATGVVSLRGIESFTLYPYDGCRADCEALVQQFAAYARAKGLDAFLDQRQREAA